MIKKILVFGLIFITMIGVFLLYKGSYGYKEDMQFVNIDLYEGDDFESRLRKFIDLIDDEMLPRSSFLISSDLNENYEALVDFAIAFIIKHKDNYIDQIVLREEYVVNYRGVEYKSNEFVNKDLIYKITNQVFGKKYFYITNEYLDNEMEFIPLIDVNQLENLMVIDKINIEYLNNSINVDVNYVDVDFNYRYIFDKLDNRYVIRNIVVW